MGFSQGAGRHHLKTITVEDAFAAYEAVRERLPKSSQGGACWEVETLEDIADEFDVFLLDAFGVLNIGETAIPGAVERIASLRARGKRCLVVTNAAGYPHTLLMERYLRLGFDFSDDEVVSSRATLLAVARNEPGRAWGMMATEKFGRADLEGLDATFLAEDRAEYDASEAFLLLGSAAWTEERQSLLEASLQANARPVWVGNPDIVAPREVGFSVEPGFFAHRLADRVGVAPRFFGKPFKNIYDLCFERLGGNAGRERVVMVGDSLHTDVLGAQTAGVASALISGHGFFGGEGVSAAIEVSGIRPDFLVHST